MTVEAVSLPRRFEWINGAQRVDLPDPGGQFSPEDVRGVFLDAYPALASAVLGAPEVRDGAMVYPFVSSVGTKG